MNKEQDDSKFDQEHLDDLKRQSAVLKKKHEEVGAALKELTEQAEEILKDTKSTREKV